MYSNNGNDRQYNSYSPSYEDRMNRGMDRRMGMGMGQGFSESDLELADDIAKAITGEVQAYNYYNKLADMAPNEQDRDIIHSIMNDEAEHYHWFTSMLHSMGKEIPQVPMGEMPTDFKEGVEAAIKDELEASAFYQDIAERASSNMIQMRFMHASRDEQRHATWLLYILMTL